MNNDLHNKGITLIALIVTIIVLLILVGVAVTTLVGEDGIIGKAVYTEFATEYTKLDEAIKLNIMEQEVNNIAVNNEKSKRIATTYPVETLKISEETNQENKITYPVLADEKVDNAKIETTLEEIIKYIEAINEITDENVELYKVDAEKLKVETKREYVINIKSGELYSLNGVKYNGKVYHRPDYGVAKDGSIEEGEEIGDIIRINIGEEKQLTTKLTAGEVEWNTSDESVVEVDQTGKIIGIAKGEATITISYKVEDTGDTELPEETEEEGTGTEETEESGEDVTIEEEETIATTQTYKVIVEGGIPNNFNITLEDATISEYQTAILEAKIDGIKVGTSYLEWESNNEDIVKVDSAGKITGIAKGEAEITCKWKDDATKIAKCKVSVAQNDTLILDKTKTNVTINQNVNIIAKYQGTDVTTKATWESEDTNIATVEKGKVSGKNLGITKVKATYEGITVECEITVKDIVTEIYTIEDLNLFASQVNGGNKFEGTTVTLMNSIDFKNEASYESKESTEYASFYTNTTTWERIGNSTTNYFKGTFNGNGNTISNLYINATTANQGLFGYSNGGIFKNINLKDVNITSTSYQVGGLLGNGTAVTISNCKVAGSISSTGQTSSFNRTGGIVGLIGTAGGNISGCVNEATISGSYYCKAGIVGHMYKGTISNCINKANVTGNNAYVSGIVGAAGTDSNVNYTVSIDNCKNYGEIQGKIHVGGISGLITQSSVVKNCTNYNTGTVKSTGYNSTTYYESTVGGIVGLVSKAGDNKIENCNNYADISGLYSGVGGIIGISMKCTITNCVNEGKITGGRIGTGGISGVAGYYNATRKVYTKSIIENCANKGIVNSTGYQTGGISGRIDYASEVKNSNNYANITGTGKGGSSRGMVGGIVGNQSLRRNNGVDSSVENCNNYGNIESSYYYCGGIVGWHQRGTIKNCTNEGKVTNARSDAGGIAGATGRHDSDFKVNGTIEGCLNKGIVTITGTGASACNAGGITGYLQYGSSVTTSGNTGDVTTYGYASSSDKTSRTGGIVGVLASYGANSVTYCYNTGNVTASYKYIGGIAGYMYTSTAIIDHCYSKGTITGPANIGGIIGYKKAGTITESYYLENSVIPTSGVKTEEGGEKNTSTIDSYINSIKK